MPRTSHIVTAVVSAAGATLVAVTLAGPLDPPAGPVADTGPDLGQILGAVQAGGSMGTPSCAVPSIPGSATDVIVTVNPAGVGNVTFRALEFSFGTSRSVTSGLGAPNGSPPAFTAFRVTRLLDGATADLFGSATDGVPTGTTGVITIGDGGGGGFGGPGDAGGPDLTIEFVDATVTGQEIVLIQTCEGPRVAERIELQAGAVRYIDADTSAAWNVFSNDSSFPAR
ncbi:MAG: hypothetical protein AAGH64_00620 [Planctomycetota bacterium]